MHIHFRYEVVVWKIRYLASSTSNSSIGDSAYLPGGGPYDPRVKHTLASENKARKYQNQKA